jgi:DNA polymerase-3 subunit beta
LEINMPEVILNTSHLKAAILFAADKDVRCYLKGVFAEVRATETRLVATNGAAAAAVLRTRVSQPVMPDVIIPSEVIQLALVRKSPTVALALDEGRWSLGGIAFTPVDGKYPPYRRIIPVRASGTAAQFDADLIARFRKAGKALGVKGHPVIRHNGDDGAQVQFVGREDEFVGVLRPLRAFSEKYPDPGLSTWGPEQAK